MPYTWRSLQFAAHGNTSSWVYYSQTPTIKREISLHNYSQALNRPPDRLEIHFPFLSEQNSFSPFLLLKDCTYCALTLILEHAWCASYFEWSGPLNPFTNLTCTSNFENIMFFKLSVQTGNKSKLFMCFRFIILQYKRSDVVRLYSLGPSRSMTWATWDILSTNINT